MIDLTLAHYERAVWDNPKHPREAVLGYLHRICVIVGAIEDDEGITKREWTPPTREVPAPGWLPYKDPPDEDDKYADVEVPF